MQMQQRSRESSTLRPCRLRPWKTPGSARCCVNLRPEPGSSSPIAPWTVRDVVVHITESAQSPANPIEFARQIVVGRPLTAQIGGNHWVDALNEARRRARTDWTPAALPVLWDRHSAAALTARRRLPSPMCARPLLSDRSPLGVHIGWHRFGASSTSASPVTRGCTASTRCGPQDSPRN